MSNGSIWPKDWTKKVLQVLVKVDLGVMEMKVYS